MSRFLRRVSAGMGAVVLGVIVASPAASQTGTTTVEIRSGDDSEAVGTATFSRTADASGAETLTVDLHVSGGIEESYVCLSDEPFTSRMSPGRCPYSQGSTGTSARFVVPLGTTYSGEPLFVQTGVVTGDSTAFAGWQDGKPFFGNVRIEAVIGTVEAPAGNLIGGLGLAFAVSIVLAVVASRRRRLVAR